MAVSIPGIGVSITPLAVSQLTGLGTGVATALAVAGNATGGLPILTINTFTPSITFGGAAVGVTYASRTGNYTVMGDRVFFNCWVALSSKGSSTGTFTLSISGIGIAANSTANTNQTFAVRVDTMAAAIVATPQAILLPADDKLYLGKLVAGANTALTDADFTDTSSLAISGSYLR